MSNAPLSAAGGKAGNENNSPQGEFDFVSPLLLRDKSGYFRRVVPCERCGGHWFRETRRDCRECRKHFAQSWHLICNAARAAIFKGEHFFGSSKLMGATFSEFRAFLERGCDVIGSRLTAYGKEWGIYHIRPLASFPPDRQLSEANALENLEVRRLHNQPKREPEIESPRLL